MGIQLIRGVVLGLQVTGRGLLFCVTHRFVKVESFGLKYLFQRHFDGLLPSLTWNYYKTTSFRSECFKNYDVTLIHLQNEHNTN